jgi:serine/threonine protein kinase/formylglycine-generating enzyme required for sulfatase activity
VKGWTPPPTFDGYRLGALLGEGGMGFVYVAHDTLLDRPVAVKFIAGADGDEQLRRRFIVEARAVARIQHPNVVSVYRVGEVDGRPYLVSELIRGEGLDRIPTPMPWARVLTIAVGIARGLATAHHRGVVHRDVKPANVVLSEDGEPKLLDFGIAKLLDPSGLADAAPRDDCGDELDVATRELEAAATIDPDATIQPISSPAEVAAEAGLTGRGAIMGTPLYMAPELWDGERATFRSDIYALGALLYLLCAGRPPHTGATTAELRESARNHDARPLAQVAPSVDARLAAIIDRCLRRDPAARPGSGNDVRAALMELTPEARADVVPGGNPYRGLHAFDADHRAVFFGRDSEIRGILERLATEPMVVVAGDSGVGKSSLCRAGVLPKIDAWLPGRAWTVASLVPGRHPIASLAAALAPHLGLGEAELARLLVDEPGFAARELRGRLGPGAGLLIFIDEIEELVTLCDAEERAAAAAVIEWLAMPSSSLRLLATVRGDFLVRLAALPTAGDAIARSLYVVRHLDRDRIREAIVGPLHARGVAFESEEMIEELVESTARAEGGLPLLQFVLAQLWEARDPERGEISARTLEAMGGVAGALTRHADDILAGLLPQQVAAARRILIGLVTTANTRAHRTEEELVDRDPAARGALHALVRGRLLIGRDTAEGPGYQIAHESLLHRWATLAQWLAEDAGGRAARERLELAFIEWERLGRAREALWGARQLAELGPIGDAELSAGESSFVAASRRAARRAWIARAAAIVVAPLAIAIVYGGAVMQSRRDLARRVDVHVAAAQRALAAVEIEAAEARALRARAYALFDQPDRDAAEIVWASALAANDRLGPLFSEASRELETASMLAPSRADVRERFGDVIYARAAMAEEQRRTADRDELLARLPLYDLSGARAQRWSAPARLSLATTPPGATVHLARFAVDAAGHRRLDGGRALGASPLTDVVLERGSYLITLQASGRILVRYPIVLTRDETARIAVDLPLAAEIPSGFVHVPRGSFLFGSATDDGLRRTFFNTAPLHEITTPGYLIAAHETTFADWIEYLRALRPEERAAHYPRVDRGGLQGALVFSELPGDAFRIAFQPTTQTYTARSGERIAYPARDHRASMDWRRFPVVGIDIPEATAYLAWLDRVGRVPGARLCTEQEWERAARGSDDREYPAGDRLAPDDANFDETYGRAPLGIGPDEVGSHPGSRSPFGVDDLVGNAWEWTLSSLAPDEYVARGSSFSYDANSSRISNRQVSGPSLRDVTVGLRVCADVHARGKSARADQAR